MGTIGYLSEKITHTTGKNNLDWFHDIPTGSLGLVHWDDPEGWYGEGSRRGVQDWEHVYTCGRCMLMYTCIQYNIVKWKKIIIKIKKRKISKQTTIAILETNILLEGIVLL